MFTKLGVRGGAFMIYTRLITNQLKENMEEVKVFWKQKIMFANDNSMFSFC